MEIKLPKKLNSEKDTFIDAKVIVIIGANGAGKTRFGAKIEQEYNSIAHRISAQKSLIIPSVVHPSSNEDAEERLFYGSNTVNKEWLKTQGKISYRWNNNINNSELSDYSHLLVLLFTEEFDEALRYKKGKTNVTKPITKLDRIKRIWEEVLPHRELDVKAGIIDTHPKGYPEKKYNASEMSDGERIIFYLIGQAICTKENSILILDEPEIHLHKSILNRIWDEIEKERPDCTFVYLTHDVDFATSRVEAKKIWIKSYEENEIWDYEILEGKSPIPEQIYLEILGSRKPIMFIEGDNRSIDYKLYSFIFSDYTIISVGNCDKVLSTTKAFKDQLAFHHLSAIGIIDRDRKTEEDVQKIRANGVLVTEVAEADNLLLLEDMVKLIAKIMHKDPENVFSQVETNIIELFKKELEKQVTQHTIYLIEKYFKKELNPSVQNLSELKEKMSEFLTSFKYEETYKQINDRFLSYIIEKHYKNILKVYNRKGLLFDSKLCELCGIANQKDAYIDFVSATLKNSTEESILIKQFIMQAIC